VLNWKRRERRRHLPTLRVQLRPHHGTAYPPSNPQNLNQSNQNLSLRLQNVDPLANSAPPRHAYESDDEDEYDPSAPTTRPQEGGAESVSVKVAGDLPQGAALIAAFGSAGKALARGAKLGEQRGAVFVNDVQVRACRSVSRAERILFCF
jgi:hypothetical protein